MDAKNVNINSSLVLSQQAWLIHSLLQTLYVALPDDNQDSDVPTRTVVGGLVDMVAGLAETLTEMVDLSVMVQTSLHSSEGGDHD